jgi:hypothetical protein
MLTRLLVAAACLAGVPSRAELKVMTLHFQPTDCASCTESLEARMKRIRGVATAVLHRDRMAIELRFVPGNQVRLGRPKEVLEQDGARLKSAEVAADGLAEKQGDAWFFRNSLQDQPYPMRGRVPEKAGPMSLKGTLTAQGVIEVR